MPSTRAKLEELMREIHRVPAVVRPPLGDNPFRGEVIGAGRAGACRGPSGTTAAGVPILNGEWFEAETERLTEGSQNSISVLKQGPSLQAQWKYDWPA